MTAMLDQRPAVPAGLCQCGCGQPTAIADKTDNRYSALAGQPRRFLRGHSSRLTRGHRSGPPAPAPAETRRCTRCGYPMVNADAVLPGEGWCRHKARGLCSTCHSVARRDGSIADYPRNNLTRDEVLEEWELLRSADASRTGAAARIGISPVTLYAHIVAGRRAGDPRAVLGNP